jgi:hypothetical protein
MFDTHSRTRDEDDDEDENDDEGGGWRGKLIEGEKQSDSYCLIGLIKLNC